MPSTKFVKLSDLNFNVKIKINSLIGKSPVDELAMKSSPDFSPTGFSCDIEAYVTCQIYSNGKPIGMEQSTTYKSFPTENIKWGQTIGFPIKYRDLTPSSLLVFTVWEVRHRKQPQSHLSIGFQKSFSSLSTIESESSTYEYHSSQEARPLGGTTIPLFDIKKKILKSGRHSLFLWRDKRGDGQINFTTPYKPTKEPTQEERFQYLYKQYRKKNRQHMKWFDKLAIKRLAQVRQQVHLERKETLANSIGQEDMFLHVELFPGFKYPIVYHQPTPARSIPESKQFFVLYDPGQGQSNPIEDKHQKLAPASGARHLKPGRKDRMEIKRIIASPNKTLEHVERDLLWKYRFTLQKNEKALPKFLRCVQWEKQGDTKQALTLLKDWAKISVVDALELLSGDFINPQVRAYAVNRLEEVENEELGLYLLQLVQALRYEPPDIMEGNSKLANFLLDRASGSLEIGNFLHWFFVVETKVPSNQGKVKMFDILDKKLLNMLKTKDDTFEPKRDWHSNMTRGGKLVNDLIQLVELTKEGGGRVDVKKERMRKLIRDGRMKHLANFDPPLSCPINPEVQLTGIDPAKSTMFKSAMCPLGVAFLTDKGETYRLMFKTGDDLRQDQLIMQMINLMDLIWKRFKLDLQLKPYRVLATGPDDGFLELVPNATNIADILKENKNSIKEYFSSLELKPKDLQKATQTFIRSCAGYCVITFILGIGDRHLDNVLLTKKGHMFHIDFGWAFGNDPKPYPPPIKFTKEMITAMGGPISKGYNEFLDLVCTAFNIIRKHANLILNLLSLMRDADIEHLSLNGVDQNIEKVRERFVLEKSDEEAKSYLISLIDESAKMMFPKLCDAAHNWATAWK